MSKTALLGLTKALAEELGPDGIRVNCIAPGIVPTKVSPAGRRALRRGALGHGVLLPEITDVGRAALFFPRSPPLLP